MKKFTVVIALLASVLMPTQAQAAQTGFLGGPLTNLDSPASIHIQLSNFPTKGGLYIYQCVEGVAGARPTICNEAAKLWVSTDANATFKPTADIVLKPTATFTGADCTVVKCGIFLRYDHTVPNDLTEDQFIALTFKTGTTATATLPNDEIAATINGVALSNKIPMKLAYRAPAILAATSKAGAVLTYASLAPACALSAMKITALKGTGFCDIAITSAGNATSAAVTSHFPLELTVGTQSIAKVSATSGKKVKLAAMTNFGEKVNYVATGSCSITKNFISAKKGSCTVVATANGATDMYSAFNQKFVIKVK